MLLRDLLLSIGNVEWIFIVFIALFLLFGTKRIAEIFKIIRKVSSELNGAKRMILSNIDNFNYPNNKYSYSVPKVNGPVKSEREKLETIANSLGMTTISNLSDEELRNMISKKMNEF